MARIYIPVVYRVHNTHIHAYRIQTVLNVCGNIHIYSWFVISVIKKVLRGLRALRELHIITIQANCYDGWTGIQTDLVIFRDRFAPKKFFLCSSYLNIDIDGVEGLPEILLLHGGGYVGEVEGGGRRIDVLVVLAPGLLKPINIQLGH